MTWLCRSTELPAQYQPSTARRRKASGADVSGTFMSTKACWRKKSPKRPRAEQPLRVDLQRNLIHLREIARRLGISRNAVRRYLRSETIEPTYAERCSKRAIDQYAFQLSAMLKTEAARSRKQRRTLKQIHEDLQGLEFEVFYDRVTAFARRWREGQIDWVNPASIRTATNLRLARHNLRIDF